MKLITFRTLAGQAIAVNPEKVRIVSTSPTDILDEEQVVLHFSGDHYIGVRGTLDSVVTRLGNLLDDDFS